jgi:hypothetical protein
MKTPEQKRAEARERYASDPLYRAKRQAAARARYEKNRDTILYEKRVGYWTSERAKRLAASARCHADAERKARYAQRASTRRGKAAERERSKKRWKELEGMRGHSIRDLERPRYRVQHETGAREIEQWPLDDAAARWLKRQTPAEKGVTKTSDTSAESA